MDEAATSTSRSGDEDGAAAEQERSAPAAAVSFSIQRRSGPAMVARQGEGGGGGQSDKDFVLSLEGKEIQSTLPKPQAREFIVPMIGKNRWRVPEGKKEGGGGGEGGGGRSEEDMALEREAAAAVLKDVEEAQLRRAEGEGEAGVAIPLLLQNKPPPVEGREDDEMADVELRPEQSTLDEYEAMPIGVFGEAVLRGMGWKKGDAIGKTNKGLKEPIEFIPHVGGLGLGALPRAAPPKKKNWIKKPGEEAPKVRGPYVDKDGRVRHFKKVGEQIPERRPEGFSVGNFARVVGGPHRDLYGKIVSVDEDTTRVVLKLAINQQMLSFSQHHLEVVSEEEVKKGRANSRGGGGGGEGGGGRGGGGGEGGGKREKQYGLVVKKKLQDGERSSSHSTDHNSSERLSRSEGIPSTDGSRSTDPSSSERLSRSDGKPSTARDTDTYSSSSRPSKHRLKDGHATEPGARKKPKYDNHDSEISRASQSKHSDTSDERVKSKSKYAKKSSVELGGSERPWLHPSLRVRIVDQKYKKGRYYNTKVVVLDVVRVGVCDCITQDGKLLEGLSQGMLETVVPRTGGSTLMVLSGENKGQLATLLEQDRGKAIAIVEMVMSKERSSLHFDCICEYVGEADE